MAKTMWALIDCNNFFVSCERVFRPDLEGKPVLVLSSNDGCVVSRSQEVKALGVPMGAPQFELAPLIKQHAIKCFSSNFRLYADISDRVMHLIGEIVGTKQQEIYSIDECFVRLVGADVAWGESLRASIWRGVGVPVTVGIAPTKTLAKLASSLAKHDPLSSGVLLIEDARLVHARPINEVWGIGSATAHKLFARHLDTVERFVARDQAWVRQEFGLGGERTWRELRGESCIVLSEAQVSHRQILRSRSFGEAVTRRDELEAAVAEYLTGAVENLRRQHWRAGIVSVFIRTSRYAEERYGQTASIALPESTSYLPDLMKAARGALRQIYRPGVKYKKAGVILSGLEKEAAWQPNLVTSPSSDTQKQAVMSALSQINGRYGKRIIGVGLTNAPHKNQSASWRTKANSCSPPYTSAWESLRSVC